VESDSYPVPQMRIEKNNGAWRGTSIHWSIYVRYESAPIVINYSCMPISA
jgi:hypothetical protein